MSNVFDGPPDGRQSPDVDHAVSRFRPTYKALTPEQKALHDDIKTAAVVLEGLIAMTPNGRYRALAITELEMSVMWAIKGLTS